MDNTTNKNGKIEDLINSENSSNTPANVSSKQKPSKISECSSNSNNKFDLPSFHCTQCSYQSIWKQAVKRHQQSHFKTEKQETDAKKQKVDCELSYISNLGDKNESKNIKIQNCKFESKESFQNIKPTLKPMFKCDQCDYFTNKNQLLSKHIKRLHEKGKSENPKRPYNKGKYANVPVKSTKDGLFQCEYCSYQTAIRTALVIHQSRHQKNDS